MGRDAFKLLVAAGILLFAVMFGMELASSGISKVYGPIDPAATSAARPQASDAERTGEYAHESSAAAADATGAAGAETGRFGSEPAGISVDGADDPRIPRLDHKPVVDRIAGGTADLLQNVSKSGIHLIAKLFSKTTE